MFFFYETKERHVNENGSKIKQIDLFSSFKNQIARKKKRWLMIRRKYLHDEKGRASCKISFSVLPEKNAQSISSCQILRFELLWKI